MKAYITYLLTILILLFGCHKEEVQSDITSVIIHPEIIINDSYIGNGAQWDPYQEDYGVVRLKVSDSDWQKIYDRLDFMKPQLMRVMSNTASKIRHGELDTSVNLHQISKILDYCQKNDVQVIFGDWGGNMVDSEKETINKKLLSQAADYIDFLVNEKGYSCIKNYNLINEPNGYWSVTDGKYELWAQSIQYLYTELEKRNLNQLVKLVGPDAAIWTKDESWWVKRIANEMPEQVGLYDIHTYPSKITVNSGKYEDILKAYADAVPNGSKIIMGEIGFKFVEEADQKLNKENIQRAESKEYASIDDSQMFVYDTIYGIDMADALFQSVNAGYSGAIVWMLDDAMYSKEKPHKLKVWGFWNILGDEFFGAEEEVVRPWFYAWSLLTKYMPQGSKVYKVDVNGNRFIKAIAAEKDGNKMIALVNVSDKKVSVNIESTSDYKMDNAKKYIYSDKILSIHGDHEYRPIETKLFYDFNKTIKVDIDANTLVVLTNYGF